MMMLYPRRLMKSEEVLKVKEELQSIAFEFKEEMLFGLCNIDEEEGK